MKKSIRYVRYLEGFLEADFLSICSLLWARDGDLLLLGAVTQLFAYSLHRGGRKFL